MAVTILERPKGNIINPTGINGNATVYPGNLVLITTDSAHGLSTGDYVYIVSPVENYNGFFLAEVTTPTAFLLYTTVDTDNVEYISTVGVGLTVYTSILTHGWSAVHLPITYRLSTNLYPVNSADTTRNVNSVQDANGYTVILLSGSLGSAVNSYDFVKLTLPSDTELSGVYQILEFISPTVMIINLEYDTANNFTGATALKHYNNYNIVVRVYAGINASHQWATQKPYELAATLQFIPDENNEAFFSINELLKSYIETRNNLTLGTLPNNIDFWTNFYIEVAESYDDSDGYVFGTYTSPFVSDQSTFEGTAVNAKLAFKNIYSGYLSEYLMTNNTAKFLTLFTIPVLFCCGDDTPDCYQDISFLCPPVDVGFDLMTSYPLSGWTNEGVPLTIAWTTGSVPFVTMGDGDTSDRLSESGITGVPAGTYSLTYSITSAVAGSNFMSVQVRFKKAGVAVSSPNPVTIALITGANIGSTSVTLTDIIDEIEVMVIEPGGAGVNTTTLNSLNIHIPDFVSGVDSVLKQWYTDGVLMLSQNESIPNYDQGLYRLELTPNSSYDQLNITLLDSGLGAVSETKQFKIDCGCSNQEIRLTWLNNLGGLEPTWAFTGKKDDIVEIQVAMTTKKNILPQWPKSYGANADTIRKQTLRVSNKAYTVRSQFVGEDQIDALAYIKSSVLVQIINSRTDRRTVIVDTDSFVIRKDGDKTHEIAFNISFTDDIPSQSV